jgi:hypothetical protein
VSFGNDGFVSRFHAAPNAMALQSDGKVVTAGFGEQPVYMPPYFIYLDTWSLLTRNEAMAAPVCSAAPRGDCGSPGGSNTSILRLSRRPGKTPTLKWSWKKGTATAADFGDPTTAGSYALCVYDGANALVGIAQVEGAGLCGQPCWKTQSHDRLAVQKASAARPRRRPGEAQDRHRQGRLAIKGKARQAAHRAAAGGCRCARSYGRQPAVASRPRSTATRATLRTSPRGVAKHLQRLQVLDDRPPLVVGERRVELVAGVLLRNMWW